MSCVFALACHIVLALVFFPAVALALAHVIAVGLAATPALTMAIAVALGFALAPAIALTVALAVTRTVPGGRCRFAKGAHLQNSKPCPIRSHFGSSYRSGSSQIILL